MVGEGVAADGVGGALAQRGGREPGEARFQPQEAQQAAGGGQTDARAGGGHGHGGGAGAAGVDGYLFGRGLALRPAEEYVRGPRLDAADDGPGPA